MATPVQAQSLAELLELALRSEPNYQGAAAGLRAAQARNRQAIGSLLPQVSASVNTNANRRGYETRNIPIPEQKDRYNSHNWQVNVTQPLWRYANIADRRQAKALVGQAEFQLAAAEQTLCAKVVEAWLDVLAARDQTEFTQRQEQAAQRQLDIARRGTELGTHGLPQREEAYAKYLQAQTERIMAEADFGLKRAALEQLTGSLPALELPRLRTEPFPDDKQTGALEQWLSTVEAASPEVEAARKAWDAARADVGKQMAGYMPSIDVVGNLGTNSQAVGGFPGQNGYDIRQSYVGLQANWSLFTSGAQTSKVREARALADKAAYALDNARRTALNNTTQAWYGFQVGQAKARSGRQAIAAAQLALRAAQVGSGSGLKAELDILQAEQQLAAAYKDRTKGYYEQLVAVLKLQALAGTVTVDDVAALDTLFIPADPVAPVLEMRP